MRVHRLPLTACLLFTLTLAGCGSGSQVTEDFLTEDVPVEQLYNEAATALGEGDFVSAAEGFEEVDRQHPTSRWASKAQVMAAYSYYQANRYPEAIGAAERFIRLHPASSDTSYAYYLIAVSYYERIADIRRDQEMTERAQASLQQLVSRYPESDYARDAQLKLDLVRDHLAGKEMDVGRYYLERSQHLAAINRFRRVVDDYQTTSHVPEALHRLSEAYLALGVVPEARKNAAVLGHNFPASEWYRYSYAMLDERGATPQDAPQQVERATASASDGAEAAEAAASITPPGAAAADGTSRWWWPF